VSGIRSALARASFGLSVVLPTVLFTIAGYLRRWAGDDGFINLRVVDQLLHGNGFVYNAGERVEAVTSAAWVLLLWLLAELGLDLEGVAWVSALMLSAVGMVMAALASARSSQRPDDEAPTLVMPLGVLAYLAIPVAWEYETSALENGLGLAFLGTSYYLMVSAAPRAWVALFVGLAPLVRPDFALYALPFLALLVIESRRWRLLLLCALPGLCFQIFRMGYFACLVPNTALAKSAFHANWSQGWLYFKNTFGTYALYWPLSLSVPALLYARSRVAAALALGGVLHILYVVRVGGDFMHGRVLLPGVFALFASVGTVRVRFERGQLISAGIALVLMAAWCVYCARNLRPDYYADSILDERRWWTDNAGDPHPTTTKQYEKHKFYLMAAAVKALFAEQCPHGMASLETGSEDRCHRSVWLLDDSPNGGISDHQLGELLPMDPLAAPRDVVGVYAFRPLGVSGRMMGLRINIVDAYGLADPLASRNVLPKQRGRPGHEKELGTIWFVAKYALANASQDPRVQAARRALNCGLLRELRDATRDELTLRRFFKNIALSFPLHALRVPEDPRQAIAKFCRS
jgi:arabinofuranosyltransferase